MWIISLESKTWYFIWNVRWLIWNVKPYFRLKQWQTGSWCPYMMRWSIMWYCLFIDWLIDFCLFIYFFIYSFIYSYFCHFITHTWLYCIEPTGKYSETIFFMLVNFEKDLPPLTSPFACLMECLKSAGWMANCSSLIWVITVCSVIAVWNFRENMLFEDSVLCKFGINFCRCNNICCKVEWLAFTLFIIWAVPRKKGD